MRVRTLLAWLVAGAAVVAFGAGSGWLSDGRGPSNQSALIGQVLDRPELRGNACPSETVLTWNGSQWEMEIGPVNIYFADPAVGTRGEVFAVQYAERGLVQKLPLRIDAPPGTPVTVHGVNDRSGRALTWEGPNSIAPDQPVAERGFLPGAMAFPELGCYQVFVDVESASYGPFGFVVAESSVVYDRPSTPRPPTTTATSNALTEATAIAHVIVAGPGVSSPL